MRFSTNDDRIQGARVAGHADIRDVKATRLHAELVREAEPGIPLAWEETPKVSFVKTDDDAYLVIDLTWDLDVRQHVEGIELSDQEQVAELSVSLTSLYSLRPFEDDEQSEPFSDTELSAFAETSGKFALYPFVREAIHDLTGRLSLPPLTMPMLKIGLTPEPDKQPELEP